MMCEEKMWGSMVGTEVGSIPDRWPPDQRVHIVSIPKWLSWVVTAFAFSALAGIWCLVLAFRENTVAIRASENAVNRESQRIIDTIYVTRK